MVPITELILLVQKHPTLWNRSCKEYKNKYDKDRAWREIYRQVEPSYDDLKPTLRQQIGAEITKKWYNVRDSYAKFKKNGAGKRARPYIYSDILSFLDPIYSGVDEKDSTIEHTVDERSNDEDIISNFEENEVYLNIEEADVVGSSIKRPKLDLDLTSKEDMEENIVAILANLIQKEEDEDRAFFKSITPSVKDLSEESRFEFRIEVMNLIKNLKRKDKQIIQMKLERVSAQSDSDG